MGAHDFETSATGMSAEEAYREAVDSARYEEGDNSYNGTISTTNGFLMYTDLPEPEKVGPILKLIRTDLGLTQSEFGSLIDRSGSYISNQERGTDPNPLSSSDVDRILKAAVYREPYKSYKSWDKQSVTPKLYQAGYILYDLKNASEGDLTQSQWADVRESILTDRRFGKRGKCACIQTGKYEYTFIGWAAS